MNLLFFLKIIVCPWVMCVLLNSYLLKCQEKWEGIYIIQSGRETFKAKSFKMTKSFLNCVIILEVLKVTLVYAKEVIHPTFSRHISRLNWTLWHEPYSWCSMGHELYSATWREMGECGARIVMWVWLCGEWIDLP